MDIQSRKGIDFILQEFYSKVLYDPELTHIFIEVAQLPLHLEAHLQKIGDFWEKVLLQSGEYGGNPMLVHLELHEKTPLLGKHFERWLVLFEEAVSSNFQGEIATLAIQRARSIAQLMLFKIQQKSP